MKASKLSFLFLIFTFFAGGLWAQVKLFYGEGYDYMPDHNGKIASCLNDGTNHKVCFDGLNKVNDIALDYTVEPHRMYYIESGDSCIRSANLDGSDKQDVITNIGSMYSLALDLNSRKVFFTTDTWDDKLYGAHMDGTNQSLVLITEYATSLFETLRGLTVDGDMLYWIRGGISCNDFIYRCKTDGSALEEFVKNTTPEVDMMFPHDIVVDNNYVYWTDPGTTADIIYRMKKDKTAPEVIITEVHASQIALDAENSKLYWTETTDPGKSKIMKSNLDGTEVVELIALEVSFPMGLIVYSDGTSVSQPQISDRITLKCYPNPFSSSTTIEYKNTNLVQSLCHTKLTFYDIAGNKVETLVDADKSPGTYKVVLNAINLSEGIYFCQLECGSKQKTIKLVLNR